MSGEGLSEGNAPDKVGCMMRPEFERYLEASEELDVAMRRASLTRADAPDLTFEAAVAEFLRAPVEEPSRAAMETMMRHLADDAGIDLPDGSPESIQWYTLKSGEPVEAQPPTDVPRGGIRYVPFSEEPTDG